MKVIPLSTEEAARSGFTHVVNIKNTDLAAGGVATGNQSVIQNIMPVPVGTLIRKAVLDVKTAWAGQTNPILQVGVAATSTAASGIVAGFTATAVSIVQGVGTDILVSTASQFITINNVVSTTAATAGEANLLIQVIDVTLPRNSFA